MTTSASFTDPRIPDGETSTYSVKLGDEAFQSTISHVVTADSDHYLSVIDGRIGDRFSLAIEQAFLRKDGKLEAQRYKAESRFDDTLVSREEGFFVGTRHLQFGGRVKAFPSGIMPLVGGLTLLRGLAFEKGAKSTVELWLAFSVCWPLEVKVEKRAPIDVPLGRFDAWQVRIRPSFVNINGLLDKVVSGLLPPFVAHFEAAGSHRMLSFSFPTGPMPWNPRAVIELAG